MLQTFSKSPTRQKPHIDVCLCTYKRPNLLKELLPKLLSLETSKLFTYSIIIVDNDCAQSARRVVEPFQETAKIKITYAMEPEANIAKARNKALELATGDLIAFIDDDEQPGEDWLLRLYRQMQIHSADVIMGPVWPVYRSKPPVWVEKGKFFLRSFPPSGFLKRWQDGRTGNLMIKRSILVEQKLSFNPEFGQGGEDQDFTRQLMEKGCKIYWYNGVSLQEIIEPERWKITAMFKKALIRGKMSTHYPVSRLHLFFKSVTALFSYSLALPFLLVLGYDVFAQYLIKIGDHAGRLLELLKLNRRIIINHER